MSKRGFLTIGLTVSCVMVFNAGVNCVPGSGSAVSLSDTEGTALKVVTDGTLPGLYQSLDLAGRTANTQQTPLQAGRTARTFGTCPAITVDSSADEQTLTVSLDFGEGCSVMGIPGFTCQGSATGMIDADDRRLDLAYDSIGCEGYSTLDGTLSTGYVIGDDVVSMDSTWDIAVFYEADTLTTAGTGTGDWTTDLVTTINEYSGSTSYNEDTWETQLSGLVVSYAANGNYIPYAGEITFSGPNIRNLVVRFDENSPSTGDVQVSIAGSPFFTVNLYDL